ncbi:hypothetical protein ACLB2K_059636 [Fragaria x ananassa]
MSYRRSLSQDLNRQGAVVLQGRNLDVDPEDPRSIAVPCEGPRNSTSLRLATPSRLGTKQVETIAEALMQSRQDPSDSAVHERLDRITRMSGIDDLQESHDHPVAPLCIKVNIVFTMSSHKNSPLDKTEMRIMLIIWLTTSDSTNFLEE